MKNILKLFTSDMKRLIRNIFAFVIAVGLCILPSLYAWFNIYSNWDPYANTSNIRVAVATDDKGYTMEDGTKENMGADVVDELKENKKIGWVFTNADDALEGVSSGKYYAAVVIHEDFTKSMVNVFENENTDPTITYYENEKKNAVATKITDTAVATLKQSINEKFVETLASSLFKKTNSVADEMQSDGGLNTLEQKLRNMSSSLQEYNDTLATFDQGNASLVAAIDAAKKRIDPERADIAMTQQDLQTSLADLQKDRTLDNLNLAQFGENLSDGLGAMQLQMGVLQADMDDIMKAEDLQAANKAALQAAVDAARLELYLLDLEDKLTDLENNENTPDEVKPSITKMKDTISGLENNTTNIQDALNNAGVDTGQVKKALNDKGIDTTAAEQALAAIESKKGDYSVSPPKSLAAMKKALATCSDDISNMFAIYKYALEPQGSQAKEWLEKVLVQSNDLLSTVDQELSDMGTMYDGINSTVDTAGISLKEMQNAIDSTTDRLSEMLDKIEKVKSEDWVNSLIHFMQGNPTTYGEYFAAPVDVSTEEVYPIANYGSAMTPFYTVLALWVGALILTALIKVKADPGKIPGITQMQLFFGRYLFFFVMGQVQALIVVLGDIFLLHCQILNYGAFWLAAAETSFVFTLLIYSLTISFGDVGKALAVVIMVIQIAGSGGTYPIELLPGVYRQIYIFFPFPYAINAMRETIGGRYGNTYLVNMLELLIFAGAGLLIGLVIRKPFVGLNHYMEKRMEDTKLM